MGVRSMVFNSGNKLECRVQFHEVVLLCSCAQVFRTLVGCKIAPQLFGHQEIREQLQVSWVLLLRVLAQQGIRTNLRQQVSPSQRPTLVTYLRQEARAFIQSCCPIAWKMD